LTQFFPQWIDGVDSRQLNRDSIPDFLLADKPASHQSAQKHGQKQS